MEEFDLRRFDEYREDNRLEVKKAKEGLPNSVWESYSSMANSNGGVILLGVEEKPDGSFHATGLQNVAKLKRDFWNTVNNPKKVSVNLLMDSDVENHELNGEVILSIRIPRARREQKPVYINDNLRNGTYRRNGEGDYHCTQAEIKAMLRDEPEETMDMAILKDFSMADLNDETVQGYRNYHAAVRPGHVWEKLSRDEYLERIGAAARSDEDGTLHPTAAGLLMFGEEYRIVRYYPEYFLDYREVLNPVMRWTDRIQSTSGEWSGNLFDFFFRVYNKLTRDLEKPFVLDGVSRVDDTPVHKAVREALANCIVNADFYLPRGIVITRDPHRIVMQNPGSIRTGKAQMLHGGISDPRNKAIMKMLNMIAIGERTGSGVPDIYAVWAENGWEDPVVEEQYNPDRTILTLAFIKKQAINTKTSEKEKQKQAETASEENERDKPAKAEKTSSSEDKSDKKTSEKRNEKQAEKSTENKRNTYGEAGRNSTLLKEQAGKTGRKAVYEKTSLHKNDILSCIWQNGSLGTSEICRMIGLSPARTRVLLGQMVEDGQLTAKGEGRSRQYMLPAVASDSV